MNMEQEQNEDAISEHSNESSSDGSLSEVSEAYSCYSEIIMVKKDEIDVSKRWLSENDIHAFDDITKEELKDF